MRTENLPQPWDGLVRARWSQWTPERVRQEVARLEHDPGMSKQEIADALSIDIRSLYRYMNGRIRIPVRLEIGVEFIRLVGRRKALQLASKPPPTAEELHLRIAQRADMSVRRFAHILGAPVRCVASYLESDEKMPRWIGYVLYMVEHTIPKRPERVYLPRELGKDWVSLQTAGDRLGVSRQAIQNWISEAGIKPRLVPSSAGRNPVQFMVNFPDIKERFSERAAYARLNVKVPPKLRKYPGAK